MKVGPDNCPSSFAGVILVSLSDSTASPDGGPSAPTTTANLIASRHLGFADAVLGDGLALLSAVFYALYVILLKIRIKEESRIDMQLFFGFVGIFNVLMLWPFGVILHFTGVEKMELPHTNRAWTAVLVNVRDSNVMHRLIVELEWFLSDANYLVERLHLCSGDVEDNSVSRYSWPQPHNTFCHCWRLLPEHPHRADGDSWSHISIDRICGNRH